MGDGNPYLERLAIRRNGRIILLCVEEIDVIQAAGNYVRLHRGNRSILLRSTLSGLEERLNPRLFLRIHRSAMVNVNRVREIRSVPAGHWIAVLADGREVNWSRGYRDRLREVLS